MGGEGAESVVNLAPFSVSIRRGCRLRMLGPQESGTRS